MAASSPAPTLFLPTSALSDKKDSRKPIENPYLSSNVSRTLLGGYSTATTTLEPTLGLRQRKTKPVEEEKTQSGLFLPPKASYSLGAGIDSISIHRGTTTPTTTLALRPAAAENSDPRLLPSTTGCWILVYGYATSAQYEEILQRFATYGRVLDKKGSCRPGRSNWVALQYESRLEAEKALCHQHMSLSDDIFVGVKRLEDNDPLLKQAQGPRRLSGLYAENSTGLLEETPREKVGTTDSSEKTPKELTGDHGLEEKDILLSINQVVPSAKSERSVCEQLARWLFSIPDE